MSLNWTDIKVNKDEAVYKLDIFFQPALTWSSGTAMGIALFFLENDPSKEDDTGQDFKNLVNGMLTWIWKIGGNEIDTETSLTELQKLYDLFLVKPFTYDELIDFLKVNYSFRIQEFTGSETMEGTIFPMFPDLTLKVGPSLHQINSLEIVDEEKQESPDVFSGQYLPDSNSNNAFTTLAVEKITAKASIFEDYGQLLMRSAIQMAIDHLEKKTETTISFSALLNEFDDIDINDLAGMVSRFMMHGVRLDIDGEERALYLATGQQFELSKATTLDDDKKPTVPFLFSVEEKSDEPYLEFIPSDAANPATQLTYTLPISEKKSEVKYPLFSLANSFLSLSGNPLEFDSGMVNDLPFYREEPRLFALRKWVVWEGAPIDSNNPGKSTYQLQIPQSLQFFLQKRDPNPSISIYQIDPSKRPSNLIDESIDGVKKIKGTTDYNWSTRINISIKRIPKSTGGGYLKDTFELAGISEDEINILESILKSGNFTGVKMHLLYASQGGTTAPTLTSYPGFDLDTSAGFMLVRNNLSTNNPDSTESRLSVQAKMNTSEIQNFIQLLWEGATVDNGGYYFQLPTDNNGSTNLFNSGDTDKIVLLIEYTSADEDPIFDFHNNVILKLEEDIALDSHLIIAKIEDEIVGDEIVRNEKVPILNIPPGFFGFNIESEIPPETEEEFLAKIGDLEILANTKLRDEPNTSGVEIVSVNKNSNDVKPINLSIDENWVFVQFGNHQGWLPKTQVIIKPPVSDTQFKLNASTVVFKKPKTSEIEIEKTLRKGSKVVIKGKQAQRIQIQSGVTKGWVPETTGFVETVCKVNTEINTAHATRELKNLYQLLGFQIKGKAKNKLPIGPTVEDYNDPLSKWKYERLVPAYTHFLSDVITSPSVDLEIPDPEKNPYKGIKTGTDANLDIQFWWQDVYGNKLTSTDPVEKSFEVKYTDPLIGINQWPSITESFQFVRDDVTDEVHLEIEFSFSPTGYQNLKPGGATARRLKADLEIFTKIYYQISQGDIDLLVHSSLNESWEAKFKSDEVSDEENLLTYIVKIYNYLFELYGYLLLVEALNKTEEEAINLEIETEINAIETDLEIAVGSKVDDLLEAELEAQIIPEIIKNIEDAPDPNTIDSYEKQFTDRMAVELPIKIAPDSEERILRVNTELKIQVDRIKKSLFDEKLAALVKADSSITPQEEIIYEGISFSKIININVFPAGNFPLEPKKDFIQGVDVSITIARDVSNIHRNLHEGLDPLKGIDAKYEAVEKSKAILSPKHESSIYSIQLDQSLQGIKEELAKLPQQSISIENIVQWNQDEPGIIKEGASFPLLIGKTLSANDDTFKSILTRLANEIKTKTGRSAGDESLLKNDFIVNFKLKSDVFNIGTKLTIDDGAEAQKQLMLFSPDQSLQEIADALPIDLSAMSTVEKLVVWNQDKSNNLTEGLSFTMESLIDLESNELIAIQSIPPVISTVHDSFGSLYLKIKNALSSAFTAQGEVVPESILNYSLDDFADKIKGQKNIFNNYAKLIIDESDKRKHFVILSEEPSLQGILETLQYDLQETFTINKLVDQLWELTGIIKGNINYHIALIELDKTQILSIENADPVLSETGDTLNSLAARVKETLINALPEKDENNEIPEPVVNFTLNDFVEIFKEKTGVFETDGKLIIESLNLRNFATNFSKAFPPFHLAVSEERNSTQNTGAGNDRSQPGPGKFLFAVHLGATGISYDIEEQNPNFYAIPPLATNLFTGKVLIQNYPFVEDAKPFEKEVNALDMNVLARDFLLAFEDFLKPETLIPAFNLAEEQVIKIIENKYRLAERISDTVLPVLVNDNGTPDTVDNRLLEAQKAIRHKLRLNLIEGYDIESIVQFQSNVTDNIGLTGTELQPRFTGRAKVLGASLGEDPNHLVTADPKNLDYLITPGYFELSSAEGSSSLTYLFDTKSPEKFGNIHLEMEFEPLEIEYNLNKIQSEFLASDKLRFILPGRLNVYQFTNSMVEKLKELDSISEKDQENFETILTQLSAIASDTKTYSTLKEIETKFKKVIEENDLDLYEQFRDKILTLTNPNYMGKSAVPIPLRNYPQPPSLIFQRAESDDSSLENISDLREWEYKIVYEHQDIAQDSIDCIVKLNTLEKTLGSKVIVKYSNAVIAADAAETAAKKAEEERIISEEAFKQVAILKQDEADKRAEVVPTTSPQDRISILKDARAKSTAASFKALEAKEAAEQAKVAYNDAVIASDATEKLAEVDSTESNLALKSKGDAKESADDAQIWATQAAEAVDNLFDALINFTEILPEIQSHIALLTKDSPSNTDKDNATNAINALNQLSSLIAANWDNVEIYNNASFYEAEEKDLHFEISEEPLPEIIIENEEPISERQATVEWINPAETREGIKPLNTLLDLPGFSRDLSSGDNFAEGDNLKTFKYIEGNSNVFTSLTKFENAIKDIEEVDLQNYEKFKDIILDLAKSNETPTEYQITDDTITQLRKSGLVKEEDEEAFDALVTKLEFLEKAYAFDPHDYGDSSIPDRVFRIENLDVLQYQNAAASIWLSRNKTLVFQEKTNPAFVFQTPAVSFANSAIPFITNDEPFNIAALGSDDGVTPQDHDFLVHMENLLKIIEPKATSLVEDDYRYEARLSCRFAFSLAKGKGLNDDLVSTLPLLIGLRLAPGESLGDGNKSKILEDYPGKLKKEISKWFELNRPIEENAYLLFSIDIFSKLDPNENSSLPMLRVKRLELKLKNIKDMEDIRTGNV